MTDLGKAIRILEGNYKNFVLHHNGELLTVNELIALLKAQEPVKPVMRTVHAQGADDVWYECSGCGGYLGNSRNLKKLCDKCGRSVKWDD